MQSGRSNKQEISQSEIPEIHSERSDKNKEKPNILTFGVIADGIDVIELDQRAEVANARPDPNLRQTLNDEIKPILTMAEVIKSMK